MGKSNLEMAHRDDRFIMNPTQVAVLMVWNTMHCELLSCMFA